jgi:hypothetical protein
MANTSNTNGKSNSGQTQSRGFKAMKEQGREDEVKKIASKGGQSSHSGGQS